MVSFTKLCGQHLLASSVWQECHATRIVWITALAMADADGYVSASVPGLARMANVTRKECERALTTLTGPDKDSRDGTTGERLLPAPGGWTIVNYRRFRTMRDGEERRAQDRERKREQTRAPDSATFRHVPPRSAQAEAEAEAEVRRRTSASFGVLQNREAEGMGTEDLDRLDMRAGFRRIAQGGGA